MVFVGSNVRQMRVMGTTHYILLQNRKLEVVLQIEFASTTYPLAQIVGVCCYPQPFMANAELMVRKSPPFQS